ncbi:hypothetical protein F5X96DRAFT_263264 [Biscogniauxia mediterranea]|nr:hypothetical protein F5X96DRAFT_263264 [Biscogniauxia mediterranea]
MTAAAPTHAKRPESHPPPSLSCYHTNFSKLFGSLVQRLLSFLRRLPPPSPRRRISFLETQLHAISSRVFCFSFLFCLADFPARHFISSGSHWVLTNIFIRIIWVYCWSYLTWVAFIIPSTYSSLLVST